MKPEDVSPHVKAVVERVLARTRENAKHGRPLDEGKTPYATLQEFGVQPDPIRLTRRGPRT